ncbi:purine-cytosine permease family protein [Saccharopolyspora dendranthemae]|uniref:Purine-cytosine permease-like protein n=1 Tax=Saccharopolyspora dendranthemae TaxID=1181886 RepID=A0A561V7Y7_9PSEU|nr:cytosine permease [Saccharopolyspora dendranthemae]TWG07722.1 purine-cytosine permease-like protein [Saccharopolyspora dendranthemae]
MPPETTSLPDPAAAPRDAGIERHGVDTIPEEDRTGRPRDVLGILLGSNMCLGVVIFGWLPASFGLGFWPAVSSMVAGTLLGTVLVAPLSLVSFRTATNLSTSSGGTFGVRGRLIGSMIGLLLSLGYAALTVWTGGAAIVGPLHRLLGLPDGGGSYSAAYAVLAVLSVLIAIFGYRLLTRLSKWVAAGTVVLVVLGLFGYSVKFSTAPVVDGYAMGDFWTTWALSAVAAGLSGPMAFITMLGDYSRYVSPRRYSSSKVFVASAVGMVLGLLVPQLFGTFTSFASGAADDYVGPLVAAAPVWFLIPLLLNGVFGTIGNAGALIYSMGLDLDAILPPLSRVQATILTSVISTALVFVGYFVWDAQDAVTAFVLLLTAVGTPWAVITLIGFVHCRGRYDPDALQVYNRRSRGGIYWFAAGWNPRAVAAWAFGSAIGLLSVDTALFRGPLIDWTFGIDLSFVLAAITTAVVYLLLTIGSRQPVPRTAKTEAPARTTTV